MRYDLDITPWDHLYSNPLSGRNTLTYCSTLVPIWPESMIYGSQVAPSIREEVLIRINRLLADPNTPRDSIVEWMLDRDEKLAGLPKRTQQVVWLKNIGYTWDEIAETLAITRDAARWAFDSCPAEVKRVLGCDV